MQVIHLLLLAIALVLGVGKAAAAPDTGAPQHRAALLSTRDERVKDV